jgi:hypothetical protein
MRDEAGDIILVMLYTRVDANKTLYSGRNNYILDIIPPYSRLRKCAYTFTSIL